MSIVVVLKPERPGEIRICVDMHQANSAIQRERHPSPTINDLVKKFSGARIFSKLDLKAGYHQLKLLEKSQYVTFSTHIGLFRYKLNFGICSASEIFQKVVDVISGIDGAFNISDDIIIYGKGSEARKGHDAALEQVLRNLKENGLTANLPKCVFRKPEMEFFGMVFSEQGISPDARKVEALLKLAAPSSVA